MDSGGGECDPSDPPMRADAAGVTSDGEGEGDGEGDGNGEGAASFVAGTCASIQAKHSLKSRSGMLSISFTSSW